MDEIESRQDDLDAATGIVRSVVFSLLFWGAVAVVVYFRTR